VDIDYLEGEKANPVSGHSPWHRRGSHLLGKIELGRGGSNAIGPVGLLNKYYCFQ
jgi:hypothetical protein